MEEDLVDIDIVSNNIKDQRKNKRKRVTSGTQTDSVETVSSKTMAQNINKEISSSNDMDTITTVTDSTDNTEKILKAIFGIQETVNNINSKIDTNSSRLDTLHKEIHDPTGGIEHRLQCVTDESDYVGGVIAKLQEQNKTMLNEMSIMKGYIIKLEQKVSSQQNQITDLVGRGMRENLIINGMQEHEGENLKVKFNEFIMKKLGINDQTIKIDRIHRFGQKSRGSPRPIVAKFHDYGQKELVLERSKEVREAIDPVKISPHFPDEIREKRKQLFEIKKQYEKENVTTKIRGNKLIFPSSGNVYKEKVPIPKAHEVLDQRESNFEFQSFSESTPICEKGNEFIGCATNVKTYNETREAVRQIIRRPDTISATHNIYAYRFKDKDDKIHQGFDDDGEFGAGTKLLKHLRDNNIYDVLVVVSRHAGEKLGPLRFTHIINAGNAALVNL